MEELLELRKHIEQGHYAEALNLIGEMEEMSRDDKINKIGSYIEVLLIHLIKKHTELRSTRSWEISMKNAIEDMVDVNKRRKAGGYYLNNEDLMEILDERFQRALRRTSLEAFEGQYDDVELAQKIDEEQIKKEALKLILEEQTPKQT